MSIREAEEELFAALKAVNPDTVEDGIVDEAEYLSAKIKIVYLMKEESSGISPGGGWVRNSLESHCPVDRGNPFP